MSEATKIPSIDDLIGLPVPGNTRISPDGAWVAYTVTSVDWKQNEFISQIWIVSVQDETPRQLTFARQSSSRPRWSPDGRWLAFLSKREGDEHTQIYRLSPFGGEAERLSEHETDIASFEWSPDGQSIAYIAPDWPDEVRKQREESFGEYQVEDADHVRSHLWLLNISAKKARRLTSGPAFHVVDFDWNPSGERIAFEAWPSPDVGDFDHGRIYLLDLDLSGIGLFTEEGCGRPIWSPDGARLAYLHLGSPTYYTNNTIRIISFEGLPSGKEVIDSSYTGSSWAATTGEDSAFKEPAPSEHTVPMKFDEEIYLEDWGLQGLFCSAFVRTTAHIFRVDPDDGAVTQLTPVDPPGWVSQGVSFDKDFSRAAMVAYDVDHYGEVTVLELGSVDEAAADKPLSIGEFKRLTDFTSLTQTWTLGQNEVICWTSPGTNGEPIEIEGILTKPVDFDPQKKYPLLIVIHGGPTGVSFPARLVGSYGRRLYPIHEWVARGALVLQPNYRGSAGYGEAFRSLNVRNLGLGDCADVVSGVDLLIEQGWADPDRVGVMGWSQGGYISAFCTTYASDRFRAASVGAGISNWITYYVSTDVHPFTRQYLGANPWEDLEIYRSTSPMTYIQRAHTPTLIQHGASDQRVPLPNAYELYQGLRDMGVETRLVTYPGMQHGPNKPRTCRQIMQENLDWFNRWIWDTPAEQAARQTCYIALAGLEIPQEEGSLPAYISEVMREARRDGVEFCLFSAEDGLVRVPDLKLPAPLELAPEAVLERARQVASQLRAENAHKLVVYTIQDRQDAATLFGLSCLHLAAGMAGEVKVEQRTIKP